MKRELSHSLLNCCEDGDYGGGGRKVQKQSLIWREREEEEGSDLDDVAEQVTCMTLHRRVEEPPCETYGLWRQEQKIRAARIEKQLKARWDLEELIDDQLNRFYTHYNRANGPIRPKDVAELLMPKEAPAHELAALAWLGDWRPSAILGLLKSLVHSSSCAMSSSSFPSDSVGVEQALSQLMHEIKIEEAVIDEEMAEIQANCVLYLPLVPGRKRNGRSGLGRVQSELKKIHRVIIKANNLRFKALEMVVKKVLSHTDAAEFLVAFVGIQDMIHQFALQQKLKKSPVKVPKMTLGV